jgi:hypothetical protein
MMDGSKDRPCSPEILQRAEEDMLYAIDWAQQAAGCEEMYRVTGDTDYELMRIEAEAKSERQSRIFKEITRLELGLKRV